MIPEIYQKELNELFVISNTPAFLYKKILNSSYVNFLYKTSNANELIIQINSLAFKQEKQLIDILEIYSHLTSLSLTKSLHVYEFFSNIKPEKDIFIDYLAKYYSNTYIPETNYEFLYGYFAKPFFNTNSTYKVNNNIFKVKTNDEEVE